MPRNFTGLPGSSEPNLGFSSKTLRGSLGLPFKGEDFFPDTAFQHVGLEFQFWMCLASCFKQLVGPEWEAVNERISILVKLVE
jgi:hypothetical protein